MKPKKLSIILPVYNNQESVERTVLSVLHQREINEIEFLIIDNNSTDQTPDILERYNDKAKVIYYDEVVDMAKNWQRAIDAVNTKYFTMIHGDDYYAPDFLEVILEKIDQDDFDLVVFDRVINNEETGTIYPISYESPINKLSLAKQFPGIATVIKTDCVKYTYQSQYFPIFDYVWFIDNLKNCSMLAYAPEAKIFIQTGESQTTNQIEWLRLSLVRAIKYIAFSKNIEPAIKLCSINHIGKKIIDLILLKIKNAFDK